MTRRKNGWPIPSMPIVLACTVTLLASIGARAQTAPTARLQLDHLNRLLSLAKENVDVSVDPAMLTQASGILLGPNGRLGDKVRNATQNESAVKSLVAGLKGVYVKVFEFDRPGVYTDADLQAIRTQLKAPWARTISVKDTSESVEVYMWQDGGEPGGLAVIIASPKELVVVNLVGKVDFSALSALQGLGIPDLGSLGLGQKQPKKDD